eukprot:scaffold362_cov142-Alexandrium_tamarense.AAC.1
MSLHHRHVIFATSSQRETEDTHHNTASLSKQRRRGRTAKNSGKEGDKRELHVGRGCDCAQAQWEVAWKLAGVGLTT